MENTEVVIYRSGDGSVSVEALVDSSNETIWATQKSISDLFGVGVNTINHHIKSIYKCAELQANRTIRKNRIVRMEGKRKVEREVEFYNLDMIISIGYRVNSVKATSFRVWSTNIIKQYMLKGYAVNQHAISEQKYEDLKRALGLLENVFSNKSYLSSSQTKDLFEVVRYYTYALDTLDAYDHQTLQITDTTTAEKFHATYENAMETILALKDKFGENQLFGIEKDKSFHSSIGQIYQTWDGKELYPSVEEKAAMLLYLVVKNHSFVDGNKRIAATLFLWFMHNNGILCHHDNSKRLSNETLIALTLMIAESHMDEMDIMIKIVVNIITKKRKPW